MRKPMLIALTLCLAGFIQGCSSSPAPARVASQNLVLDKDIHPMDRQEVIQAIRECETQRLRAIVIYGKRKINNQSAITVVDVTCAPSF